MSWRRWRAQSRLCSYDTPGEPFLPVRTPFQLQEASQGWPFCLLIRQTELLHLKIRLHRKVKEMDASSSVRPPLVSPLPALISMHLVSTRLPLPLAPELLEGRNCISLTVVSAAPLTPAPPCLGRGRRGVNVCYIN